MRGAPLGLGIALHLSCVALALGGERVRPVRLPIREPVQITAEADPVLGAAVSRDGRRLVYVSGRGRFTDLWIRSADPAIVELPQRLTSDPASESSPSFSADGRWIAYVGTGHDAKGDIYLLGTRGEGTPKRVTGREARDGGPVFSPDGNVLYFHRALPGKDPQLASLTLDGSSPGSLRVLTAAGEGQFPAVSPDGSRLVFVTRRLERGGDLFLFDLETGRAEALTGGPALDSFPAWSPDGRAVYFSRRFLDTDRDGAVTERDGSILCRIRVGDGSPQVHPLTVWTHSGERPLPRGTGLFFLSSRRGVSNLWSLPLDGVIPSLEDPEAQGALARDIQAMIPPDPPLAVLAHERVLERFPRELRYAAEAAYAIGPLYLEMELPDAAEEAFQRVVGEYSEVLPEAALARVQLAELRARRRWRDAISDRGKREALDRGFSELHRIAATHEDPRVRARSRVAVGRLSLELGREPAFVLEAISVFDDVVETYPSERAAAAEALFLRAEAYGQVGGTERLFPAYGAVLERYADQGTWADSAVQRLLDLSVATAKNLEDRLELLRRLSETNRGRHPRLAMGALNRVGDLLYAADEWTRAKSAYRQVLEEFPEIATQTAAARLALAEILYREERFRQALDLYETELRTRPVEDYIYRLARRGYIRKSVEAAEFLYRVGELASARSLFKELIRYDDRLVEAHRGYIKAAAAQGDIQSVLAGYRSRLADRPLDPLALYLTGLCLTYMEDREALEEARSLITRAIGIEGQVEYYHQTLGYILEVLETVYGARNGLELAVESYQKAYFLNDPEENPTNAANLLLNLGNVYHLLGQHRTAVQYYERRLLLGIPFDDPETEILYYRRFGTSAFQVRDSSKTIDLLEKALALVRSHANPKRASSEYDRLNREILDRILAPASNGAERPAEIERIAETQSGIRDRLFHLTQTTIPEVPSSGWEEYRQGIEDLLAVQEEVNRRLIRFLRESQTGSERTPQEERTLGSLVSRVGDALRAPVRFAELERELTDRLGLAYQDAGRWEAAARSFEEAYSLNERLGRHRNLGRNRRSVAYTLYQLAEDRTGQERRDTLGQSAAGFRQAVELVREHGVPSREEEESEALIGFRIELPLDEVGATQAAFGFSAEQEERLIQAFLARIHLELGELEAAEQEIEQQLARYPADRAISDRDVYGVSLLHHRAGLVAFARGHAAEAFDHFRRSAELTRRMGNAASTALNVINMARAAATAFEGKPGLDPHPGRMRDQLAWEDRQATRLIARDPTVSREPIATSYHNALGLFWLASAVHGDGLEASVRRVGALERAGAHFSAGILLLGDAKEIRARERLAGAARLHVNLARVGTELGDRATEPFHTALELSQRGALPELTWRALVGLGRLEEALTALEGVSPLRASCGPGEITGAFAPLVEDRLGSGRTEEAFALAERLSELERVHRLAPLVLGSLGDEERAVCRRAYERLLRIRKLREDLRASDGEEEAYLRESLTRELGLIDRELGAARERLPGLAARETSADRQDVLVILLGLAAHAEEIAETVVGTADPAARARGARQYRAMLDRFEEVRRAALEERREGEPLGTLGVLGPNPVEAVEVMENLRDGEVLIRLVRLPDGEFVVFQMSADEFAVDRVAGFGELQERMARIGDRAHLTCDDPAVLAQVPAATRALSSTHWLRAFESRKPFKRSVLALPSLEAVPVPAAYEVLPVGDSLEGENIPEAARLAHTLILAGRILVAATVPTRAGEPSAPYLAMDLTRGRTIPLDVFLAGLPRASLSLLTDVAEDAVYPVAHLLTLAGSPTVVFATGGLEPSLQARFLEQYAESSAVSAARVFGPQGNTSALVLGYPGMESEEAADFAEARFVAYARESQRALQAGRPLDALAAVEDAILTARESDGLGKHLAELYQFAREAAFQAGKMERAAAYAEALVRALEEARPDTAAHAEALLRLGLVQARLERYERAVATLEEAQEILANLELGEEQARALASLGIVLESATEYDRALAAFRSAATLSEDVDQEELLARQYVNVARIYDLRLSQWAKARQSYQQALSLYDGIGDVPGVAQALLDVGRCHRLLGNFPEAAAHYEQSLELLEEEPDEILRAKVIIEQANNAWFQGRYEEAFELQRVTLRIARENRWDLGQVMARNTSGLTWWTLGDNERALRELNSALDLARNLEVREDEVATALNNIGLVYREMGRYDEAIGTLQDALAIDRRLRSRWAVAYDLRNLGLTKLRQGDLSGAISLLQEAADEAGAIGDRVNEAKALQGLGEALHKAGRSTEAEDAFRKSLDLSRAMALRETEWRSLHGIAQVEWERGASATARGILEEALEVIEAMRADIKLEQLRDGFLANKLAVYEMLVSLLVGLGDAESAFEVAERSRSRNFIDLLGTQRLNLAGRVDQDLYDRQISLRARLGEQEALLAQAVSQEEQETYRDAVQRLRDEQRALLLEVQARNPELAALVSVQPVGLEAVRSWLGPQIALLAYYLLPERLLCWVIQSEGTSLVQTPIRRESLADAVFAYRRLIQNLEPLDEPSRELHRILLEAVLPAVGGKRYLGIIPHRSLHYLSFATVANPEGYLVDGFATFYLPSASVLQYTLERRVAGANRRILAVGNPDLGNEALELPFAEEEVGTIRWNFPDVVTLTGDRATEAWVTRNLGNFGIIHLASHGEFDPINPLFSAIKLSKDPGDDGDLRAAEVFGLEINADLVVLSACQTGVGKVTEGDDIIGLNRAFFYAGTHTIISSLWRVSDISTALIMKHFYRHYATRDKAESLRSAILYVKNRYPHPGYWGAFILSGDYQ